MEDGAATARGRGVKHRDRGIERRKVGLYVVSCLYALNSHSCKTPQKKNSHPSPGHLAGALKLVSTSCLLIVLTVHQFLKISVEYFESDL